MRRLLVAAAIWAAGAGVAAAACAERIIDLRGPKGMSRFSIEIADTPETRERGLMYRTDLAQGQGMLFIFDPPREVGFWMKNTPLPLDLVFIDARGAVRNVIAMAEPYSERILRSGAVVRAVLEINGGLAATFGIAEGSEARHPAFGPDPVWPCD